MRPRHALTRALRLCSMTRETDQKSSLVSASTGWYPQPRANQSLLQFLSESVTVGKTNIFLYFKSFFIESIKYFQGRDQEAADGDQTSEKREEDAAGETETGAAE